MKGMYFQFARLALRLLVAIYQHQRSLAYPEYDPLIREVMDWEARYK